MAEAEVSLSKVLVVDSDSLIIEMTRTFLSNMGVTSMISFANGTDALPQLEKNFFDLIIFDWRMKQPTGREFLQACRTGRHSQTPLLLLFGMITVADVQFLKTDKMVSVLRKPFTQETFYKSLLRFFPQLKCIEAPKDTQGPARANSESEKAGITSIAGGLPGSGKHGIAVVKGQGVPASGNERAGEKTLGYTTQNAQEKKAVTGSAKSIALDDKKKLENTVVSEDMRSTTNAVVADVNKNVTNTVMLADKRNAVNSGAKQGDSENQAIKKETTTAAFSIAEENQAAGKGEIAIVSSNANLEDADRPRYVDPQPRSPVSSTVKLAGAVRPSALPPPVHTSQTKSLKRVLVAGADDTGRSSIVTYLKHMEVPAVDAAKNGLEAWNEIKKQNFDVIILDWKLQGPSGLAIYNRLRQMDTQKQTPIVVVSGLVHKQDFRILTESQCVSVLEIPCQFSVFNKTFNHVLQRSFDFNTVVEKVRNAIQGKQYDDAALGVLIKDIIQPLSEPVAGLIAIGEEFYERNELESAKKVFRVANSLNKNNPVVHTWIGKILLRQGMSDDALKWLSRANDICHDNVERLCLLGEAGLSLKDPDAAQKHFSAALKIDVEDETARAGMVLAQNMAAHLSDAQNDPLEKHFSSMLNTIGVSLVRNGQFTKGMEQYRAALCFLKEDLKKASVKFNLGLASLRRRDYEGADFWLNDAVKQNPALTEKADKYIQYVRSIPPEVRASAEILKDGASIEGGALNYQEWMDE